MSSVQPDLPVLLGSSLLVKQDGKPLQSGLSVLDGKYIGLYFSAHWCPPCRGFTPKLRQIYESLRKAGKPFEIVFVSSDQSQAQFDEYYAEMPWAAIPHSASGIRAALSERFGVSSIPTLVMLAPDGRVLSRNARGAALRSVEGFPWEGEEDASGGMDSGRMRTMLIYLLLAAWVIYRIFFSN